MADVLTPSLRLTQPTTGADGNGAWPAIINADLAYIDAATNGIGSINIGGETTYSLLADGSASDQARYAIYDFTGALSATCTVTIPSCTKIGVAQNNTTGPHNVILTTGSGTTLTLPGGSAAYFGCDGENVFALQAAMGGVTNGSSAPAGTVGEYTYVTPSGVAIPNETATNVGSLSLTAGVWEVAAQAQLSGAGAVINSWTLGISPVSNTLQATNSQYGTTTQLGGGSLNCMPSRISLTTTTTIYLVAYANIASGAVTALGCLRATRAR